MSLELYDDPFNLSKNSNWHGELKSLDGTPTTDFSEDDVEEILYSGTIGDEWDGKNAAIIKLRDGRFVAYESSYGPTGSGFSEDAYGGDADVFFASSSDTVIKMGLTDEGRRVAQIPEELWK